MKNTETKPLHEMVADLQTISASKSQKEMIENLRSLGLLHPPKYNLACGPTAQTRPTS